LFKFRIRALQPNGLANLMKLQNIYKKSIYNVPTLGKLATSFECNFNIENVETFIVLTHWIQTQSSLNFGQISALTATLV
jgi:hypothetical protein